MSVQNSESLQALIDSGASPEKVQAEVDRIAAESSPDVVLPTKTMNTRLSKAETDVSRHEEEIAAAKSAIDAESSARSSGDSANQAMIENLQATVTALQATVTALQATVAALTVTVAGKAPLVHNHAATDITTGQFSPSRIPYSSSVDIEVSDDGTLIYWTLVPPP